jgi:hypothetical protein
MGRILPADHHMIPPTPTAQAKTRMPFAASFIPEARMHRLPAATVRFQND